MEDINKNNSIMDIKGITTTKEVEVREITEEEAAVVAVASSRI